MISFQSKPIHPRPFSLSQESSLSVTDLKEYTEAKHQQPIGFFRTQPTHQVIRSVRKRHMPVVALLAEAVRKMTLSDPWMEGDDFQPGVQG